MNKLVQGTLIILLTLCFPTAVAAQMTSTNFQVEKYSVGGFGQSVNATSTNYGTDLEPGGLYEYGDPVATTTPGGGGGSGSGGTRKSSPKEDIATSTPTKALLIGPKQTFAGNVITLAVEVQTENGIKVETGGETVVITVNGANNVIPKVTDLGNGVYIAKYLAANPGIDVVTGILNRVTVREDTDGVSDGRLHIIIKEIVTPELPPIPDLEQEIEKNEETNSKPRLESDSILVDYGVTAACNRAFTWNNSISATIYKTEGFQIERFLTTTSARMPWFVDTEPFGNPNITYDFEFSDGSTTSVQFNESSFVSCTSNPNVVIESDIDSDNTKEEYIEGIFQDQDGSSVPLAITPDGIVLDTNADNEPDLFWNPGVGTSSVISAGDRIYITDSTVAPTQNFLPYTPGTSYRVHLSPAGEHNVALSFEAASLIELSELPPLSTPPFLPFGAIGFGSGVLLTLWRYLNVPFSITNIWRVLLHGWHNFIELFAFKKKSRPWGTVYDSRTRAPVDPAYVELFDTDDKKHAEAITDLDGRYGFVVSEGSYYMKVRKTHYTFPSTHHTHAHTDIIYSNLYYGGQFDAAAAVARDIPMDPLEFDWNQYEKMRTHQTRFIHRFDPLIVWLFDVLFWLGAAFMIWEFYNNVSLYNGIMVLLYFVMLFYRFTNGKPLLYGTLRKDGKLLPYAIVRVMQGDTQITSKVADMYGRYAALVAPGTYTLKVEEMVNEGEYQTIYEHEINAKKGIINSNLRV